MEFVNHSKQRAGLDLPPQPGEQCGHVILSVGPFTTWFLLCNNNSKLVLWKVMGQCGICKNVKAKALKYCQALRLSLTPEGKLVAQFTPFIRVDLGIRN